MATETQIVCTVKSGGSTHHHIVQLGTAAKRLLEKSEVIRRIDAGIETFFTYVDGKKAYLHVRDNEPGKVPYVQTAADGFYNNNLLALNSCPI